MGKKYTAEERAEAVRLAKEIGTRAAAERENVTTTRDRALSLKKEQKLIFVLSLLSHGRGHFLPGQSKNGQKNRAATDSYSRIVNNIASLLRSSQKCDIIYAVFVGGGRKMAVSYKRLLHLMIEKDVTSAELMRRANISANIISKIKNGQYMALDKVESICVAMGCTPNDILEFTPNKEKSEDEGNG